MLAKLRRWLLSDEFLSFGLRIATIGAMLVNNVLVARLLPDRNAVGHYFELWGIVYFIAVIGHLGLRHRSCSGWRKEYIAKILMRLVHRSGQP